MVSAGSWSLTGLSLDPCHYAVAIQTNFSGSSSEVSIAKTTGTGNCEN